MELTEKQEQIFDEINGATGFANGEKFVTEEEVREYFTVEAMEDMGINDNLGECENILTGKYERVSPLTQTELTSMADYVIDEGLWMAN